MRGFTIALALFSAGASAYPRVFQNVKKSPEPVDIPEEHFKDDKSLERRQQLPSGIPSLKAARDLSKAETNCGPNGPCLTFNEDEQFVSVTGPHRYASPGAADIRGPCPGLNAASNHGYLPRDGVATIPETITGLGQLYGMSVDLAGFLAAYAVVLDGDIVSQTWSIGGPPNVAVVPPLLQQPQGISFSHNKYEGDNSIGRPDAYLNNGDAHSLSLTQWKFAYEVGKPNDRYTMHKFRRVTGAHQQDSVKNNPYYFAPLFSTTLVSPAAYNFVINFMSNHSAEEPSGYLDSKQFKQFFAVKGEPPNWEWLPGQERIPKNWYRRPSTQQYNAVNVFQDLIMGWAAYPETFRFGGNTNGTNSYEGVNIADLTGGVFNRKNILQDNNFACLLFQTQQQAVPDQLKGILGDISPAMDLIAKFSNPIFGDLGCPELSKYDQGVFNKYPGRNYNPKGEATNY